MSIRGLWPNDLKIASQAPLPSANTPEDVLTVQAQDLGAKTNHLLEGRIERGSQGEWITLDFYISVPSLDHYSYHLLKVRHRIPPYPLEITVPNLNSGKPLRAMDRTKLENHLKIIFGSGAVRKIIQELLTFARPSSQSATG